MHHSGTAFDEAEHSVVTEVLCEPASLLPARLSLFEMGEQLVARLPFVPRDACQQQGGFRSPSVVPRGDEALKCFDELLGALSPEEIQHSPVPEQELGTHRVSGRSERKRVAVVALSLRQSAERHGSITRFTQ